MYIPCLGRALEIAGPNLIEYHETLLIIFVSWSGAIPVSMVVKSPKWKTTSAISIKLLLGKTSIEPNELWYRKFRNLIRQNWLLRRTEQRWWYELSFNENTIWCSWSELFNLHEFLGQLPLHKQVTEFPLTFVPAHYRSWDVFVLEQITLHKFSIRDHFCNAYLFGMFRAKELFLQG